MTTDSGLNIVIGAGPSGRGVMERLHERGRKVRLVTRTGRAAVPPGVEHVAADVANEEAIKQACAGGAVVFCCLGLPTYPGWLQKWPAMMQGVLAGAAGAGARLVFMDNLYMYGPVDGPLREDLPLTDYGRKPALRARLTRMWQDAHAAGRVAAAAVRASDFYGPGVRLAILGDYVTKPATLGKSTYLLGNPAMPHTFAYMPDVARALVDVADGGDDVYGHAWHVPSAPARPVQEVVEMIYREAGHPSRYRAAPPWLVALLGVFDPDMRELKEMLYQWTRPFEVDHSKFAARFWGDYTPLEEGVRNTVAWFKEQSS